MAASVAPLSPPARPLVVVLGSTDEPWVVEDFKREAVLRIQEIRARGNLPIVVGGTHYYTNALLFEDILVEAEEDKDSEYPILDEPTEVILAKLREADPVMADRWHPNDRRKIRRSLQIFLRSGQRASEIYLEQRNKGSASEEGAKGTRREPWESLLLWVHSDSEVLKTRLDVRVDKMVDTGLMDEVHDLYQYRKEQRAVGKEVDLTRGIWQSIGFKEFQAYLEAVDGADLADVSMEQREKALAKLKADAIADVKTATRRYAGYQTKWIRRKVIPLLKQQHPDAQDHLFAFDSTDVSAWAKNVASPAADVTRAFLAGETLPRQRVCQMPQSKFSKVPAMLPSMLRTLDLVAPRNTGVQYLFNVSLRCQDPVALDSYGIH
ncbi:unnamed protein product [Parascedosporium putredinis]|uniref:tRNA dimethylallyltransferase n=1 Tax=Parascedosporium putredinis TaxID=1442378 RepID=A0A9P1MAY1_9PEZI|nr:unnamed protein product [Parascedosporium putredinis]CAI7994941.1 unnamed protein product [Parascedosporium putredinis]